MSQQKTRYIFEADYNPEKSWQLLEWCLSKGESHETQGNLASFS